MRSFIAIELEHRALQSVARIQQQLAARVDGVRWATPDQMHLTLKFLGEVESRSLSEICDRMDQALKGINGFAAQMEQLGVFPNLHNPRVLWLGVGQGANELREMHHRLDQHSTELGLRHEGRGYIPHITLGRLSRQANKGKISEAIEDLPRCEPIETHISKIHLFSSVRRSGQVVYETVYKIALQ
jgi:RNA 2',3'-cyclic 3'-phosphodiesterase